MLEGDGLGEVDGESGVAGVGDVLFHAEAADGDGVVGAVVVKLVDEVDAGAVREADIADEQIEGSGLGELEGIVDGACDLDVVVEGLEEACQEGCGLVVILDEQDAQGVEDGGVVGGWGRHADRRGADGG